MAWLNAAQVAAKIGRSVRHFRERIAVKPSYGFPAAYRPGGMRPLWDEDEVDEWISRGLEQPRSSSGRSRHAEAA